MTQAQLARRLGVTQPYLSMLEKGRRPVPSRMKLRVSRVLDTSPTDLPVQVSPQSLQALSATELVDELSKLDYPGFAYLRKGSASVNPAQLLLSALASDELDARSAEALPWLLLRFDQLNTDVLVREAKLHDLQNKLGFVVALAREVAERNPAFHKRLTALRSLERRLEDSRLLREEMFGPRERSPRLATWVRDHRSNLAKHWNVLSDLKTEHLPYAAHDSGAMA